MTGLFAVSNQSIKAWLLLPAIALNGWVLIQLLHYFEPLVTIFIVAAVLAFILNYPVEFLQRHKVNRIFAVFMVLLLSLVGLGALGITLLPALLEQVSGIVEHLPDWLGIASQKLQVLQNWASAHRLPINLSRLIRQSTERLPERLDGLGDETVLLTLNAVGGISSALLTLVLTLYLLLDGNRVWNALFQLFPANRRASIQRSLHNDFHSYFIGQATLGLVMAVLISVALFVLKVPYSLLLGSTIGIMTLVPFGDTLGFGLASLLVAAQSPGLALTTLIVCIVIDQVVDQAIAPRILGGFTGLKPIWVIIALVLGTKLFGLPGLLIAVPVASFINRLLEDPSLPEKDAKEDAKVEEIVASDSGNSLGLHAEIPATPLN